MPRSSPSTGPTWSPPRSRPCARSMGEPVPPAAIRGVHAIPLERGLGSSSAAAVAGVVIASLLLELGWEADPWSVFAAAAEIEGHPDNAAPAVFGGFTVAMPDGFVHRADPHPALRPVAIVPPARRPDRRRAPCAAGPGGARRRGVQRRARGPRGRRLHRGPSLLRRALGTGSTRRRGSSSAGSRTSPPRSRTPPSPGACRAPARPSSRSRTASGRSTEPRSIWPRAGASSGRAIRSTGVEVRRG